MFIVTNYGGGSNYTPSVFETETEARAWMKELVASNLYARMTVGEAKEAFGEFPLPSDEDLKRADVQDCIIDYAEAHFIIDFNMYDDEICIGDPEEGGNIIQMFEFEPKAEA